MTDATRPKDVEADRIASLAAAAARAFERSTDDLFGHLREEPEPEPVSSFARQRAEVPQPSPPTLAEIRDLAFESGIFGQLVQERHIGLPYWELSHDDVVEFDTHPSRLERNPRWRHLYQGGRVFVPDRKPQELAYLYVAARRRSDRTAQDLRIRMRQGRYWGIHGTLVWRALGGDGDD